MPFLLLLFLGLACMPIKWPRPADGWNEGECAALTWGAVAALVATAALIARWVRTRIARDPAALETILHRYSLMRLYHLFGLFAVFGTALSGLGWGWTVRQWCTPAGAEEMLPLAEFV